MNKYQIIIEGANRTGKSTLKEVFNELTYYKYVIVDRGLMSVMAYNHMYNRRSISYDLKQQQHSIYVVVTADLDDIKLRCKITHEPEVDSELELKTFDYMTKIFIENGITVLTYNSSHLSLIDIAKDILQKINEINGDTI
jgi:thymidylate kinase